MKNFFYIVLAFIIIVSLFVFFDIESPLSEKSRARTKVVSKSIISPGEAIRYVGDYKTVCGEIVSSTYASYSNGKPTFLNLDKSYPNHIFTIVIWGNNRYNFESNLEDYYLYKNVCVEGKIETYKGKAQIEAKKSSQIKIQ